MVGAIRDINLKHRLSLRETPNPKHQITNKFQITIFNDQNILTAAGDRFEFWISGIVICLLFDIWNL